MEKSKGFFANIIDQYKKNPVGLAAFYFVAFFAIFGLYAPFFASSKPLIFIYDHQVYFPLFRYLFFEGFFTKRIDLFYNLLMLVVPLTILAAKAFKTRKKLIYFLAVTTQFIAFFYLMSAGIKDPASDPSLNYKKQAFLKEVEQQHKEGKRLSARLTWKEKLQFMTEYEKINRLMRFKHQQEQDASLQKYATPYAEKALHNYLIKQRVREKNKLIQEGVAKNELPSSAELDEKVLARLDPEAKEDLLALPTLWRIKQRHQKKTLDRLNDSLSEEKSPESQHEITYIKDKKEWYLQELSKVNYERMPFVSYFHWQDDAGGEQALNQYLPFWLLTRINQKDLVSSLIFGIRVSLMVGILAVFIQLLIGIPIGATAGFFGGKVDIAISRILEVWEGLPTFFMLLMVVAVLQSKSIFLVVCVLGVFGWTGISRFMRGEVLKQRNLPYVEALRCCGFTSMRILFRHILPNAIPPILTLLPFAIMGAISSEAGLSFLGLGEEGSCSWGVLMDEGRIAFPGESYLLWPPAVLLTMLLIAIALIGDALRDAFDPKMHRS